MSGDSENCIHFYLFNELKLQIALSTDSTSCAGIAGRRRAPARRAPAGETVPHDVTNVVRARTLIGRAERHTH